LDGILQTLKKIGWVQDVVSLELFRPEYYQMDPDDVYRIGKEKSEAVIKRNF
jgi:2-keto-myo-inositol isomerase